MVLVCGRAPHDSAQRTTFADPRLPKDLALLVGIERVDHAGFLPDHQHALSVEQGHQNRRLTKIVVGTIAVRTVGPGSVGIEARRRRSCRWRWPANARASDRSQARTQQSHRSFRRGVRSSCRRSRHRAPDAGHRWSAPTTPARRTDHGAGSRWHFVLSDAAARGWCSSSRSACRSRYPVRRRCRERCSIGSWSTIR